MKKEVARKSAIVALGLVGAITAFTVGAQAGLTLNGRVMSISVARMPAPPLPAMR
jgi:hypothetical protein